jgi:hypothetical protein
MAVHPCLHSNQDHRPQQLHLLARHTLETILRQQTVFTFQPVASAAAAVQVTVQARHTVETVLVAAATALKFSGTLLGPMLGL